MDRFEELQVFVAVIQQGSMAGAARILQRSPPVITRTLSALETRFGTTLIERTTRQLAPTEAGWQLFEQAQQLLSDYQHAMDSAHHSGLQGLLRITAPVPFGRRHVMPLVNAFLQQHPEMQIEVVLSDSYQDLIENGLDIALRIGELQDSSMVARKVGSVRSTLVASPDYLKRAGVPSHPADLHQHAVITSLRHTREWRFAQDLRVRILPRLRVNDIESQLETLRGGQGIGRLLSYQVMDDLQDGKLIRLLPEWEPAPLPVQLVTQRVKNMTPKVRQFWDFALDQLPSLACFAEEKRNADRNS
ncbi:LysR family transcriptional regulator [Pantoea sp. Acro-805]|jgi:DNA-binding transcriptional LysR family regulator|uniref:LysR family transcriptional regulator n=1 Tax=Candidatus Pantoea formicae TaxID=2608355 RepID=A0ABX0R859_9GAMM|nr:LysR family transcriptional regulator [Pantoea formicae]MDF7650220.1 LysR family transcriptional regulator [Erwiniaceae bacterium L1_54_3]NIF03476.1 LysR family transcriptional regulator [Pantoea formicae]